MRNPHQKTASAVAKGPREGMLETPTHSMQADSEVPERPEGRDALKRRSNACADTESSDACVEMLRKIHEKGQLQDEQDTKYKEHKMNLAQVKFELQQKEWQANYEISQQQMKLEMNMMSATKLQAEFNIMFTNTNNLHEPLKTWVQQKQQEILHQIHDPQSFDDVPSMSQ
jgi:hypothetical protein